MQRTTPARAAARKAIRDYYTAHPDAKGGEVIAALKKAHPVMDSTMVYNVRTDFKAKSASVLVTNNTTKKSKKSKKLRVISSDDKGRTWKSQVITPLEMALEVPANGMQIKFGGASKLLGHLIVTQRGITYLPPNYRNTTPRVELTYARLAKLFGSDIFND